MLAYKTRTSYLLTSSLAIASRRRSHDALELYRAVLEVPTNAKEEQKEVRNFYII